VIHDCPLYLILKDGYNLWDPGLQAGGQVQHRAWDAAKTEGPFRLHKAMINAKTGNWSHQSIHWLRFFNQATILCFPDK
jgi:hypothetical protein